MFIRIEKLQEINEIEFLYIAKDETYQMMIPLDPTAYFINAMLFDDFSKEVNRLIGGKLKSLESDIQEYKSILYGYLRNRRKSKTKTQKNETYKYPLFLLPLHQVDMTYNVIKRSVKDIMYISDSELRIKSNETSQNVSIPNVNGVIESLYQNIVKYLTRVQDLYPVYVKPDSINDENIFVKNFAEFGDAAGIWESTELNKKNNEEDYRNNGKYRISAKFFNVFDFITAKIPEKPTQEEKTSQESNQSQEEDTAQEVSTSMEENASQVENTVQEENTTQEEKNNQKQNPENSAVKAIETETKKIEDLLNDISNVVYD